MIGDYPTQSFFRIDPFSGNITNTVSLKSDNLRSQQYTVSGLHTGSWFFFKLMKQISVIYKHQLHILFLYFRPVS